MDEIRDQPAARLLRPRKRIAAREVPASELAPAPDAPRRHVAVLPQAESAAGAPATLGLETVLDPTVFSERRRKRRHTIAYRATLAVLAASFLLSAAGVLCLFLEDPFDGQWISLGGALLAGTAFRLVNLTRLSARLKGYAVAAFVSGAVAFGANLVPSLMKDDSPAGVPAPAPQRPRPPAPPGVRPGVRPANPR